MAYRIPPDDVVAKALDDCLVRTPRLRSQRELCDIVRNELAFTDQEYRISGDRIRRIGIERGIIDIEISYAASDRAVGNECPVCGNALSSVRNRTLDGGTVELSRSCRLCGYVASGNETRPARYGISRRHQITATTRASMLREAESLLLRAAELMDGALRMSGLESRSGKDSDTVRRIASDPSYGGSLRNIALDIERLEKNPVWTQPLTSPKNLFPNDDDALLEKLRNDGDELRCNLFLFNRRWREPMKIWEFAKVKGSSIKVDDWMSDTMGLVDGGIVYSTLFKHPEEGPKDYEIILSMFPQENYRTLTHITMYLDDVPGSSAQAARFLSSREINILNSISLDGISDTVIIWKLMADLNFAGEGDILVEDFEALKAKKDPSVSKIKRIDIKPAEIGRLFKIKNTPADGKTEIRRGYPSRIDGGFDVADQYGDILKDIDGENVLITMDADSWVLSITFFKKGTRLVKAAFEIPDCPGGIEQVLEVIAEYNVNLISVFSKVKICNQVMYLELVMDIGKSTDTFEQLKEKLPGRADRLNGIYTVKEFTELR